MCVDAPPFPPSSLNMSGINQLQGPNHTENRPLCFLDSAEAKSATKKRKFFQKAVAFCPFALSYNTEANSRSNLDSRPLPGYNETGTAETDETKEGMIP